MLFTGMFHFKPHLFTTQMEAASRRFLQAVNNGLRPFCGIYLEKEYLQDEKRKNALFSDFSRKISRFFAFDIASVSSSGEETGF